MGLTFVSYFTTTTKRRGGLSSVIVIALLLVGTTEPVLSWRTSTYLVLAALLAERSMASRSILDPTSRGPRLDQRSTPPTSVGTPS